LKKRQLYQHQEDCLKLNEMNIRELRRLLDNREVSVRDVLDDVYGRIDAIEDKVKAFITVSRDEAYRMAEHAQESIISNRAEGTRR
jgi:aspartyl-tRNA(Asn)/glutamyl-tRNA(Gln) amidotransferase subunit A